MILMVKRRSCVFEDSSRIRFLNYIKTTDTVRKRVGKSNILPLSNTEKFSAKTSLNSREK